MINHYQEASERWRLFAAWHRKYGSPEQAQHAESRISLLQELLSRDSPPFPLSKSLDDPVFELEQLIPPDDRESFQLLWWDRFRPSGKKKGTTNRPERNTIRAHVADYLELYKARKQAEGKLGSYNSIANWLKPFVEWVSPTAALKNRAKLMGTVLHPPVQKVNTGEWSTTTAENYFVPLECSSVQEQKKD